MPKFNVITIFPEILDSYIDESILGRARKKKLIGVKMVDLRKFASDKHRSVDDTPYGGGAGMVMKVDVWERAIRAQRAKKAKRAKRAKVVLLTPAGKQFDQRMAERYAKLDEITFVCGRYEGIDARVERFVDEKVSVGPYVLAGGELGAAVIIEAVARNIPGALGNKESLSEETFSIKIQDPKSKIKNQKSKISSEYPQYTRPEVFEYRDEKGKVRRLRVPKVLLSGDHGKIREWRGSKSKQVGRWVSSK